MGYPTKQNQHEVALVGDEDIVRFSRSDRMCKKK